MELHYHPLSTYSQKVLIALFEMGIEFEPKIVNMFDPEQRAQYRSLYPIGKVPLLVLDDGHPIPESSIIVEYLNSISDGVRLIPDDPTEARKTRFLDRMYDLYLNNNVGALFFELRKPDAERSQSVIDGANEKIAIMYNNMEDNLSGKHWNRGEMFTMADCAAGPPLFYAQQIAPFDDKPNIKAFWERFSGRPSYQRIMAEAKPYLDAM
ncbi:MAG: glutathione S-transferase family protein [Gammaproteobacteria bacterium]|nr:glutathione S-transferase family protein [Gammaproteobacteria bacterium]